MFLDYLYSHETCISFANECAFESEFPTSDLNASQLGKTWMPAANSCLYGKWTAKASTEDLYQHYSSWFNKLSHFIRDERSTVSTTCSQRRLSSTNQLTGNGNYKVVTARFTTKVKIWRKGHSVYCSLCAPPCCCDVRYVFVGKRVFCRVSDLEFWLEWPFHCTFLCWRSFFCRVSSTMDRSMTSHLAAVM